MIPTDDTFQKLILKNGNGVMMFNNVIASRTRYGRILALQNLPKLLKSGSNDVIFKQEQPGDTPSSPKSSWQAVGEPDAPSWKLSGTQGTSAFWEISGAPLLPKKRVCNYNHPKQHGPFPERLRLPYSDEEIS